jgi:hypothetical protein
MSAKYEVDLDDLTHACDVLREVQQRPIREGLSGLYLVTPDGFGQAMTAFGTSFCEDSFFSGVEALAGILQSVKEAYFSDDKAIAGMFQ